jgi:hypothetical protein
LLLPTLATLVAQEVMGIAALLAPPDPSDGCFITSSWLEGWASSEASPEPVDNSLLLCEHHKLNPAAPPSSFKFISSTAWQEIVVRV